MSNKFWGTGNIGHAPELRNVKVDGESRPVVNLRVYIDRNVRQPDGSYKDVGGFWLPVALWDHRAESAMKLLQKGMRIDVSGSLRLESWQDNNDEENSEFRLAADHFSINPICLEGVQLRKRNGQSVQPEAEYEADIPDAEVADHAISAPA